MSRLRRTRKESGADGGASWRSGNSSSSYSSSHGICSESDPSGKTSPSLDQGLASWKRTWTPGALPDMSPPRRTPGNRDCQGLGGRGRRAAPRAVLPVGVGPPPPLTHLPMGSALRATLPGRRVLPLTRASPRGRGRGRLGTCPTCPSQRGPRGTGIVKVRIGSSPVNLEPLSSCLKGLGETRGGISGTSQT